MGGQPGARRKGRRRRTRPRPRTGPAAIFRPLNAAKPLRGSISTSSTPAASKSSMSSSRGGGTGCSTFPPRSKIARWRRPLAQERRTDELATGLRAAREFDHRARRVSDHVQPAEGDEQVGGAILVWQRFHVGDPGRRLRQSFRGCAAAGALDHLLVDVSRHVLDLLSGRERSQRDAAAARHVDRPLPRPGAFDRARRWVQRPRVDPPQRPPDRLHQPWALDVEVDTAPNGPAQMLGVEGTWKTATRPLRLGPSRYPARRVGAGGTSPRTAGTACGRSARLRGPRSAGEGRRR